MSTRTTKKNTGTRGGDEKVKQARNKTLHHNDNTIIFVNPAFLVFLCPNVLFLIYIYCTQEHVFHVGDSLMSTLHAIWNSYPTPTLYAIQMILAYCTFEAILLNCVPGKMVQGPVSPAGEQQTYKDNGLACYLITLATFVVLSCYFKLFSPAIIYDEFGPIISSVTLYVLVFCVFLQIKGTYFPSGKDKFHSGSLVNDFFWGVELYPFLLGLPLKQYVNCRLGMVGWNVVILSFAFKQIELTGALSSTMFVNVLLQTVYILKFFYWESGYFRTIDIMHDRFGFYICWGCMCWITGFYTSSTLWLVNHPIDRHWTISLAIILFGLVNIWINFDADHQRQRFRLTNGKDLIWGRKPSSIVAHYTTDEGKERTNLLLTSGWWGLARHFHYVPEILLSLSWVLSVGTVHWFPYIYTVYLIVLLFERGLRDEVRCSNKYGKDWAAYCSAVPYRIIPYIY